MLRKLSLCALLVGPTLASPASALVIFGSGQAIGERISLRGNLVFSSGPLPVVTASGPPADGDSVVVSSLNLFQGSITSGALTVNAAVDVDGAPGVRSATADATVDSLVLAGFLSPWLTLTSTTIGSSAEVTGEFGTLATSGTVVLDDLAISVFGVPLAIPLDPIPNTVLYDAGGIRIVLNEQGVGFGDSDGVITRNIVVRALHIEFTNAIADTRILNGVIVASESRASLSAKLPEPSAALLGLGAGGMLAALRRRPGS